ncbi:hypothetical protein SAMN05216420_10120 [Nitrosospira sp. Nl5]|nr:hypothetical protein SAMN05216420_10120 [Nitrosospira sp. Nl5]
MLSPLPQNYSRQQSEVSNKRLFKTMPLNRRSNMR